jgi:hypothetical protein
MSLFSLWKEIFQLPSAKRRSVGRLIGSINATSQGGQEKSASAARFYHMLSAASSCGEYEKVCNGEFFLVTSYIYKLDFSIMLFYRVV